MFVQTAQDLFSRRLGDVYSSACFLAQHIPSMVSATQNEDLRKLLNLYLDIVRDNADRSEAALRQLPRAVGQREPTAVPAMVDDFFDVIEGLHEPSLVDVAIIFSSSEIGTYEAQRFHLLSEFADQLGRADAIGAMKESGESLSAICDQLREIVGNGEAQPRPN